MILTIDKKDLEIFEKVCALKNFEITRYPDENIVSDIRLNPNMIYIEILYRSAEPSTQDAFYLGREVQQEIDERLMKRVTE